VKAYLIHWNAPSGWLSASVASFLASDIPVELTVVNNGPVGAALGLPVSVRVIEAGANLGFAGGANLGIADWMGTAEPYCVVAAHDAQVKPHALRRLIEEADADPQLGVIGAAVQPGGYGELLETRGPVEIRTWASGTCLLLRRECIEEIGTFETRLGSYCEDLELGLRATRAGWAVAKVTDAPVAGRGSAVGDVDSRIMANDVLVALRYEGRSAAFRQWVRVLARFVRHLVQSPLPGGRGARHRRFVGRFGSASVKATRFLLGPP
jgi:N-acetylglucosaminyl-diphospho-decaprenol L-rhamnosyltransferase